MKNEDQFHDDLATQRNNAQWLRALLHGLKFPSSKRLDNFRAQISNVMLHVTASTWRCNDLDLASNRAWTTRLSSRSTITNAIDTRGTGR
jgi:hypothetical protein